MQSAKAQIRLRIHTVRSRPSCPLTKVHVFDTEDCICKHQRIWSHGSDVQADLGFCFISSIVDATAGQCFVTVAFVITLHILTLHVLDELVHNV